MNLLACVLLLAASTSVELVDEVYQIAPAKWNFVEINLRQRPALVTASFDAGTGPARVRLALMTRGDAERMLDERPHGVLAATAIDRSGALDFRVRRAGDYVLVVDNRSSPEAAAVHLRIALDFAGPAGPEVTRLAPRRQFTVILLSFAAFFAVVTFSARKLLRAVRKA